MALLAVETITNGRPTTETVNASFIKPPERGIEDGSLEQCAWYAINNFLGREQRQ